MLFVLGHAFLAVNDVDDEAGNHCYERAWLYSIDVSPLEEVAEYQHNRCYDNEGNAWFFQNRIHNYMFILLFSDYKVTHKYLEKEIFFLKNDCWGYKNG